MQLRTRLLITALSLTVGTGIHGADGSMPEASASATSIVRTPVRGATAVAAAASATSAVEPTPGEKVAQRQREVFVRERFEAVFGAEVIEGLTRSKGIAWDVLSDTSIPFDASAKRSMIRNIKQFFLSYMGERTVPYLVLADDVMRIDGKIAEVPENRLEEHARRYFTSGRFEGATVDFRSKIDGDQLGRIVIVRPVDGPEVKYYVKTHSGGVKAEKSTGAKPVNAIELMVYKVLEGLGVGCETHFFGRDEENFYIATRDAGAEGAFEEYSKVDRKDQSSTGPVWGVLSEVLVRDDRINEGKYEEVEAAIATDSVAQNFIEQISMLDVLARLMLLTDLQTNGGNFGFVRRDGELPVLRVIDFRLCDVSDIGEHRFTLDRYRGFLVGNGFFRYASADEAVCYALRNRPKELRVREGVKIFDRTLIRWGETIERAHRSVREALVSSGLEGMEITRLLRDLDAYTEILKENFRVFEGMLREYRGD